MSVDQIADMLTRIRNAQCAGKHDVSMPASNFKIALAKLFQKNGYIDEVSIFSEGNKKYLRLRLRYVDREPAIKGIRRVSRQGQRIYIGKNKIPRVRNGYGIAVISTSQGVLTDDEARKEGLGGEMICEMW
ncbi:MAG: 30S ribosomal protein S8 [Patescibacteria group bacterium]|nr:30S ribosomal protein S8 [Patescibacteria group bacterium]